jgi:hypothetical protein
VAVLDLIDEGASLMKTFFSELPHKKFTGYVAPE